MKINAIDEKKMYTEKVEILKPYLFRDYAKIAAKKLHDKYYKGGKFDIGGKNPNMNQLIQRVYNVVNCRVMDWDTLMVVEDTIREHFEKIQKYFNNNRSPVAS